MTNASILGVIVDKLQHKKKPYLIILLEIDESLEVGFYYTILPLSLTVHLQMEGGEESPLNIEEIV